MKPAYAHAPLDTETRAIRERWDLDLADLRRIERERHEAERFRQARVMLAWVRLIERRSIAKGAPKDV